ncbi:unnamed protein product [Amoebophrya sp. A25]|nr:unnamed protein product [Amoebophrya sp. A25]|eukprot:GSA25T00022044001.1
MRRQAKEGAQGIFSATDAESFLERFRELSRFRGESLRCRRSGRPRSETHSEGKETLYQTDVDHNRMATT